MPQPSGKLFRLGVVGSGRIRPEEVGRISPEEFAAHPIPSDVLSDYQGMPLTDIMEAERKRYAALNRAAAKASYYGS